MRSISFFELLVKIGLIVEDEYGYTFPDYVLVLTQTPEGIELKEIKDAFLRWNETNKEKWVEEFEEYCKLARERNRYYLSLFAEKRNAQDFFKRTKVAIRIDIDEPLKLNQVLEIVNNRELLPIQPTHILRTIKGWHIFYITQDFIEYDNNEILYMIHSYTEDLKSNLRKYADRIDHTYSIATRYSNEIYELREPYTKEELLEEINKYYDTEVQINGLLVLSTPHGTLGTYPPVARNSLMLSFQLHTVH